MSTLKIIGTGSSGNSYLLSCDNKTLILDAGVSVKEIKKALNFDISSVVGCFITHIHNDHSYAAEDIRNMGIPMIEPYKGNTKAFKADGFSLHPFKVPHDDTDCYGALIICPDGYKLLYATDFEYIPYTFKTQRLNGLLIECNYTDFSEEEAKVKMHHVLLGHASLSVTKGVIEANKTDALQTVIACHLSQSNADADLVFDGISEIVDDSVSVYIAEKGMKIEL